MNASLALVLVGNLADGYEFIGPFESAAHAADYAWDHCSDLEYHVVEIRTP